MDVVDAEVVTDGPKEDNGSVTFDESSDGPVDLTIGSEEITFDESSKVVLQVPDSRERTNEERPALPKEEK
jgi:homoserine kinase